MRAHAGAQGEEEGEEERKKRGGWQGKLLVHAHHRLSLPHFLFSSQECHCMLFLTPDNDFAGTEREITMEEIEAATAGM